LNSSAAVGACGCADSGAAKHSAATARTNDAGEFSFRIDWR
jgi:hypothetical protein